ncbi:MAG: ribonuclease G, partial [Candidatus Pelagisphaera sp.]
MSENKTNTESQDSSTEHEEELRKPPSHKPVKPVDQAKLKSDADKRAKKRPLMTKIIEKFKGEKLPYRELIINAEPLETRVGLLIDGVLDKFDIERRRSAQRIVGGIFKGRIKNLDPGLKAAFVDIGLPKNAFLHYWDILP